MTIEKLNWLCDVYEVINRHRDPYELNHGQTTSKLVETFGAECGISGDELHILKASTRVHDIGKIAIAENILNKPTALTDIERIAVNAHVIVGWSIVFEMHFSDSVNRIALCVIRNHHENYDGTGYPDQMRGNEIPIYARILRICDTYTAMIAPRPYRVSPIFSPQALEQMMQHYEAFDPDLLAKFVKMMASRPAESESKRDVA